MIIRRTMGEELSRSVSGRQLVNPSGVAVETMAAGIGQKGHLQLQGSTVALIPGKCMC